MVDMWSEKALININNATTDVDIAAITESIDIDAGDKDVEFIANCSGGRLEKLVPGAETTITFEGYPVGIGDIDATTSDGLDAFFHGGTDTAAPFTVTSSSTRGTFTVTIMWTDSTVTSATTSIASGKYALRYNFANCRMVSCKPTFSTTDGLKATWKFKCAPFTKTGTGNITVESADGNASMPSI